MPVHAPTIPAIDAVDTERPLRAPQEPDANRESPAPVAVLAPLLGLAPLGAVLALDAWFLVNSRLRHAGVEDFLDLVTREAREIGGRDPHTRA